MKWLCNAQDATNNGGVAATFDVGSESWTGSYPETTGYIMQTFVDFYEYSKDKTNLDRAIRMAEWEIDILTPEGGTPGQRFYSNEPVTAAPVAFNTGQVAIGLSSVLKQREKMTNITRQKIESGAQKIIRYLRNCINSKGFFEKGLSEASAHGRLSHNLMTSWGLYVLSMSIQDSAGVADAIRTAEYYMNTVNEHYWPNNTGIDDPEKDYPRTHALGYHIQGLAEIGLLENRSDMIAMTTNMLKQALPVIDQKGNFSGRVKKNWRRGADWNCLTGSSQFAIVYSKLGKLQVIPEFIDAARRLNQNVIQTQVFGLAKDGYNYGVRGSFPFSIRGYNRASYNNWAAKFHVDSLLLSIR